VKTKRSIMQLTCITITQLVQYNDDVPLMKWQFFYYC